MPTNDLLQFLRQAAAVTLALLTEFEGWLRDQLQAFGASHAVQSAILIGVMVLLVFGGLRLFAGLIRVAVVVMLILVILHLVLPVSHG